MKTKTLSGLIGGLIVLAAAVYLSGVVVAADLHEDHIGSSCDGEGTWHFVNNQARGAAAGTLTAHFTSGDCVAAASAVNRSTQHFFCFTSGASELTGASTDLPGKLVLSSLDCEATCNPTEEVCDGVDNNCNGQIDEGLNCTCTPTQEICDGIDNDCDNKVDEGCP